MEKKLIEKGEENEEGIVGGIMRLRLKRDVNEMGRGKIKETQFKKLRKMLGE